MQNLPEDMDSSYNQNDNPLSAITIVFDGKSDTIHEYIFNCARCKNFHRIIEESSNEEPPVYYKEDFSFHIDNETHEIPLSSFGEHISVRRYIGVIAEYIYAYELSALYTKRQGILRAYSYISNTDLFTLYKNDAAVKEFALYYTPVEAYEHALSLGIHFNANEENAYSLVEVTPSYADCYYHIHPYTYREHTLLEGNCFHTCLYRLVDLPRNFVQLLSYKGETFETPTVLEYLDEFTKEIAASGISTIAWIPTITSEDKILTYLTDYKKIHSEDVVSTLFYQRKQIRLSQIERLLYAKRL